MIRSKVFPVFIPQSGCPFQCLYCNQYLATGQTDVPSPVRLRRILDDWLPRSGGGEIAFYGGSFTLLAAELQDAYLDVAKSFIEQGRVGGIRLSTRPDGLGFRQLERLAGYPVTTVEVGSQSFSDLVLHASRRGYNVASMETGLSRLRQAGPWRLGVQLMPGLPGSSFAEGLASMRAALKFDPDFFRIYPTLVLAGTELDKMYQAGQFHPLSLERAVELGAGMTALAIHAAVPVERLGLQGEPGWRVGKGGLRAGPYHPAFGQLVRSALWQKVLSRLLSSGDFQGTVVVPLRFYSDALGQRRENLGILTARFGTVRIEGSRDLEDHQFMIDSRRFDWRHQILHAYREEMNETIS